LCEARSIESKDEDEDEEEDDEEEEGRPDPPPKILDKKSSWRRLDIKRP
jgi:hypothetical protein